jgi:uncharacterized protein
MPSYPTYIYLHGFASGPSSTKARFFQERLESLGLTVHVPDLNGEGFQSLTLTSQLEIVGRILSDLPGQAPVVMVGSSMGGLLSTLQALRDSRIKGLILLAPGFGLPRRWEEQLGADGLKQWKESGMVDVFHHAMNTEMPLNYSFIEDAQNYETDELIINVPALVFHGEHDETVPVQESIRFAQLNPKVVDLHLLDCDHSLIEPLEGMWAKAHPFLVQHGFAPAAAKVR